MILGFLETVDFNGKQSFESQVEIQGRGGVGMVVIKITGEDLKWGINFKQKGLL